MHTERLNVKMTKGKMIMLMGDENEEAIDICIELMRSSPFIDPDEVLEGPGILMDFDSLGIYGKDIVNLYRYVCGQDLAKMIALVRANLLGELAGITREVLWHAIKTRTLMINFSDVMDAVREVLPAFNCLQSYPMCLQ
jgi:hypothetical protein